VIKSIATIILLLIFIVSPGFASECNESGPDSWVICEDWDIGTVPEAGSCSGEYFPYDDPNSGSCQCYGSYDSIWHDWTTACYGEDSFDPDFSTIATDQYHSPGRSFKNLNDGTAHGAPDTKHSFTETSTAVSIRFYLRIDQQWTGADVCVHGIFFNTASSAEFCIDFRQHSKDYPSDPSCTESGNYIVLHTYSPSEHWRGPCFNFNDHLDEWVLVEMHYNFQTNNLKWYINESKLYDDTFDTNTNSVDSIVISCFQCYLVSQTRTLWLDDIVVDNTGAYIGPRQEGGKGYWDWGAIESWNAWHLGSDAAIKGNKLAFKGSGANAWAVSPVVDTDRSVNYIRLGMTEIKGSAVLKIRGSSGSFEWNAGSPAWEVYAGPYNKPWQYIQVKVEVP